MPDHPLTADSPSPMPGSARSQVRRVTRALTAVAGCVLLCMPAAPVAHAAHPAAAGARVAAPVLRSPALTAGGNVSDCARLTGPRSPLRDRPRRVTLALAAGYGSTSVRVTHCVRRADGRYAQAWVGSGRIGRQGFARPGAKREGDGRTPSGRYPLVSAFGAKSPGTRLSYRTLRRDSCWGSTVGSARYNRYFRGRCGPADETMYRDVRGAYAQGLVIGYNTAPIRQGRGSAIFVHASTGRATSGCVSLPLRTVTRLLKATRSGDVIVMGVR